MSIGGRGTLSTETDLLVYWNRPVGFECLIEEEELHVLNEIFDCLMEEELQTETDH